VPCQLCHGRTEKLISKKRFSDEHAGLPVAIPQPWFMSPCCKTPVYDANPAVTQVACVYVL